VEALIPNPAELIPALIAFAVVFFVLSKFAWPAISDMLDKRADTIREGLERAEAAKIEAERLLAEYKQTMADARKEAGTILQQAKQAAEAQRSEATAKTQADIDEMLAKARESIEGERRAAIASLQASVAELSVAVAGKLIGSELSADDHHSIIEKYVSEAGSLNAN
jgi:F-type H+-transporting ATPase subunit b